MRKNEMVYIQHVKFKNAIGSTHGTYEASFSPPEQQAEAADRGPKRATQNKQLKAF